MNKMIKESEIIEAGKILKTHGLKGELNAVCEYDSEILNCGFPLIIDMDGILVPFYLQGYRPKGAFGCLVHFKDVESADEAKKFVNKIFYLRKKDVAGFLEIEEDELMVEDDFIGYRIFDSTAGYLGRLQDIDTSTDNWLMLVEPDNGAGTIYLPFVEDWITQEIKGETPRDSELHFEFPEGVVTLNDKTKT